MKKLFLLLGMAAAMVNFAGCQKNEIEDPNANAEGSSFELVAEIAQTKTTLDGLSVEWEEGDVLYLVTEDGTWGAPDADDKDAATIAEYAYNDGKFTTGSKISDGEYTFNAMYARADQKSYHRGASTTHKLEATQSQDCANPTAHIKENDALVGTFTATTPMTEAAQVTMSHIYTMMQVDVKNNTGAEIEVATFEMTAEGADLAGVFNVESFETPSISTKSGASSTITVNITNGTVAAGKSLPVYFVMAPLSDYSGDVTFKVTDASGKTYTKTVTLNGISFEAGKYNTTPYTISSADVVEPEPEETTVTFDFTSDSDLQTYGITLPAAGAGTNISSMTIVNGDVAMTSTDGSTNTRIWNSYGSYDLRVYKDGGSLTYSVPTGYAIKTIEFTGSSLNSLSSSQDTYTSPKWSGNAQTVKFIASATVKVSTVTVVYIVAEGGENPEPQPKTLVSIAVENPQIEYTIGDEFVEPTVKATYDDASTETVTGATFTGYDMTTAGEQTVTVSYTEGEVTETTTYDITVSPAEILVEDGTYVIAVKEDGVYYAASTEANGTRRAYVELSGYTSGNYVSHDSKIVWTITNKASGITVSSGDQYWKAVKNGISMVESGEASMITVAKSTTDDAYLLSCDLGSDGIRYVSKNTTYGFGFYAESNKEDIYFIPATFVELPTLNAPVVEALLNGDETGIDVSWGAVENATSYVVSCTNQTDQIVTSGTQCSFTDLPAGTYTITVTANAEGYNSARSEEKSVIVPLADTGDETVAASGTILWAESWADAGVNSTSFTNNSLVSDYTYAGRSGYGDNATSVTYTSDASNNVRITKSSGGNCTSGHLWFNKDANGELKTSAIKLYGATSLTFSHSQGTSGSECQTSYSIDGGSSWTTLGKQSGAIAKTTYTFEVPSGTESIMIKLSHASTNSKNTRVDNLELKVN